MPRAVLYDIHPLDLITRLDEFELLANWIIAAYNGFGTNIAKSDPKRAGDALGEFPRPLHRAVLRAEVRTQVSPIEADYPPLPRRQPRRTRRVSRYVVHRA